MNVDPRIRNISDAQWREMSTKLRLHTWKKYGWLSKLTGIDLDDIAQQAIVDTFTGKRRWPPIDPTTGIEKLDVSLFYFLCQTVRSIVSHNANGPRPIDFDRIDSPGDGPPYEAAYAGSFPPFLVRPADIERAAEYNDLTDKMLELISADEDLSRIIKLWRACPDLKPREIAEELHITMPELHAARKRLRRRLDVLRRKQDE
jgi:DNA-directed RNA polymerase specialized sigma24 family protein